MSEVQLRDALARLDLDKIVHRASIEYGRPVMRHSAQPWLETYHLWAGYDIYFDDGVQWTALVFPDEIRARQTVRAMRFARTTLESPPLPALYSWALTPSEVGVTYALTGVWEGRSLSEVWDDASPQQRTYVLDQLALLTWGLISASIPEDISVPPSRFTSAHDWMQDLLDRRLIRVLSKDLQGYVDPVHCLQQLVKLPSYVVPSLDARFVFCPFWMPRATIMVDAAFRIKCVTALDDWSCAPLQWAARFPTFVAVDEQTSFEWEREVFLSAFARLEAAESGGPTPLSDTMGSEELRVMHESLTSKSVFKDVWVTKYAVKDTESLKLAKGELVRFLGRHPHLAEMKQVHDLTNRLTHDGIQ